VGQVIELLSLEGGGVIYGWEVKTYKGRLRRFMLKFRGNKVGRKGP